MWFKAFFNSRKKTSLKHSRESILTRSIYGKNERLKNRGDVFFCYRLCVSRKEKISPIAFLQTALFITWWLATIGLAFCPPTPPKRIGSSGGLAHGLSPSTSGHGGLSVPGHVAQWPPGNFVAHGDHMEAVSAEPNISHPRLMQTQGSVQPPAASIFGHSAGTG